MCLIFFLFFFCTAHASTVPLTQLYFVFIHHRSFCENCAPHAIHNLYFFLIVSHPSPGRSSHMVYEGAYSHHSGSYYERQAPSGVEKGSSSHPSQSGAPGGPGGSAYYSPYPSSSYSSDHQLTSSRATLMNDFLTAQQMPRRKVSNHNRVIHFFEPV